MLKNLLIWFAIETLSDFYIVFMVNSNAPTPNYLRSLKGDIYNNKTIHNLDKNEITTFVKSKGAFFIIGV